MRKPARLLTFGQLSQSVNHPGYMEPSVELESNRPIEPNQDHNWYWEVALVRRGHPLRQLCVMTSIMAIQATLVHMMTLISPVALAVYGILWILLTLSCGIAVIQSKRLTGHALVMYAILFSGAIVGII